MVVSASKYDHVTPILPKLHWLPVDQCIQFTVLLTTYKAMNGEAPEYLCDLVSLRWPFTSLRSCNQLLLHVPLSCLKPYGDCAFRVPCPTLWNGLPEQIRKGLPFLLNK